MIKEEVDYIVVGQGIAGTVLSHFLLKSGKDILVIDDADPESTSQVSAGMINPVTLRRLVPVWRAREKLKCLKKVYREMEAETGMDFYETLPFYRIFKNKEDRQQWEKKQNDPDLLDFLDQPIDDLNIPGINSPFGAGAVNQTGFVHTSAMIYAYRELLEKKGVFIQDKFEEELLEFDEKGIKYASCRAKNIVFCSGYASAGLSFFPQKALRPLKGELLHVEIKDLPENIILNSGFYLLPTGNHTYILGATYEREETDREITKEKREELIRKLRFIYPEGEIKVIAHYAGIRPTVPDQKALIGSHPDLEGVYFFNGLGTRGVITAPLMARYLTNYIENNEPVHKLVDFRRFY